jgi:hypothetical protein
MKGQKGKRCDEAAYLEYTHKFCKRCESVKAIQLFRARKSQTLRGWSWDTYCIDCRRAESRDYGRSNKRRRNLRLQAWRKKNAQAAKARDRRARLKAKYGVSESQVDAMRTAQHGACAICEKATTRLMVDHDHVTGKVRALLCQTCNTFLGWYEKKAGHILRFQRYLDLYGSGPRGRNRS